MTKDKVATENDKSKTGEIMGGISITVAGNMHIPLRTLLRWGAAAVSLIGAIGMWAGTR